MSAARNSAFNRGAAIASIQINWKAMSPDGDRDERLAWISEYLGCDVSSLTDLSDNQLGSVAGEMKRLTGQSSHTRQISQTSSTSTPTRKAVIADNVIEVDFSGRPQLEGVDAQQEESWAPNRETVFLSSPELIYTLEKLLEYIGWPENHRATFLIQRFGTDNLKMLTFKNATKAVNTFLRIAAHQDLKKRKGADKPVSRAEVAKYIPMLKERLSIDRRFDK